jgi:formate hydrogenlyase subunit 3/multisubunit Na+/H+ antiporter MnhD subunit
MPSFPVLTIILLLLAAGVTLGLSRVPRVRSYTRYIALTVIGLATALILTFRWREPIMSVPSLWQPSLLLGVTPTLNSDITTQPLALALTIVACSAILVELSRTGETRPGLTATLPALLAAALVSLWAANPLTMIIGWAFYDLLQAAGHISAGGSAQAAVRGLIFGGLATLLLWGGASLLSTGGDSGLWALMTPSDGQLALWAAAGTLRFWVYPFHLSVPDDLGATPSAASLLQGPVIGWGLWLRLASVNGGSLPDSIWVSTIAAIALAIGYFLAWSCTPSRAILPWIGMGTTGAVLLAAMLAGERASEVITSGSVAWALGMTTLFLTDGLQREAPWWNIPSLVGALALLGVPPTPGFVSMATLLEGVTKGAHSWWGVASFFGNLFLVPSLARWLLAPAPSTLPNRRWLLAIYGVGLGLPALLLILTGLRPSLLVGSTPSLPLGELFATPGWAGWLLWGISLAGGGVLAWQDRNLRPRIEILLSAAHDLMRLEWLYDAVVGAIGRGLSVLRAADEVVRGAGALLWSWLLFLLILLIWGRV